MSKFSEGDIFEAYKRSIRFARVNHRAWHNLPGYLFIKSLGKNPVEIAVTILNKYVWSVLISVTLNSGNSIGMRWNWTTGIFLILFRLFLKMSSVQMYHHQDVETSAEKVVRSYEEGRQSIVRVYLTWSNGCTSPVWYSVSVTHFWKEIKVHCAAWRGRLISKRWQLWRIRWWLKDVVTVFIQMTWFRWIWRSKHIWRLFLQRKLIFWPSQFSFQSVLYFICCSNVHISNPHSSGSSLID